MTPLSAVGLCCVLVARKYTLKRNVVKAGERSSSAEVTEGGQSSEADNEEERKLEDGTDLAATTSDNVSATKLDETK